MENFTNSTHKEKADHIRHLADKRNLESYDVLRDTLLSWYPSKMEKNKSKNNINGNGKNQFTKNKKKNNTKSSTSDDDDITINITITKTKQRSWKQKAGKSFEEITTNSTKATSSTSSCDLCGMKNHQLNTCKFYLQSKINCQQQLQNRNFRQSNPFGRSPLTQQPQFFQNPSQPIYP